MQGASTGAQGRRLLQSNSSNLPGVEVFFPINYAVYVHPSAECKLSYLRLGNVRLTRHERIVAT